MRQTLNKLKHAGWGARSLWKHGWPRALIHFSAGVGDELMLTAVIRELRKRGTPPLWVMSQRPELFQHNPDIAAVVPVEQQYVALAKRCGAKLFEPRYTLGTPEGNLQPPPAHMITCMMATAGITGPVQLAPVLHLTSQEKLEAESWAGAIFIQSTALSAGRPNPLKEWGPDRWQHVVEALRPEHRLVQIGGPSDPLLDGVVDLRGHGQGLRKIAAMLSQARLFLGLESGYMHLARAAGCPGVIVFGGRVAPHQAGYDGFVNIVRTPACSPCWRYTGCEFNVQCMREVEPAAVITAAREFLARPVTALTAKRIDITSGEQQRIVLALAP